VGHTDSGGHSGVGRLRGLGEHEHVLVGDEVDRLAVGACASDLHELPQRRTGDEFSVADPGV
jgi:hypothetical protein